MTKQPQEPESERLVSLSVRVSTETAAALKLEADRNYRPVAAHVRFLIESDIAQREAA